MRKNTIILALAFFLTLSGACLAADIDGAWITSEMNQIPVEYAEDTGTFWLVGQYGEDAEITLYEVDSTGNVLDTYVCPYDIGRQLWPSMRIANGNIFLPYSARGLGRLAKFSLANREWINRFEYNDTTDWVKVGPPSIEVVDGDRIYVAFPGYFYKAWGLYEQDPDVLGIRSTDGGETWTLWSYDVAIKNIRGLAGMLDQVWEGTLLVNKNEELPEDVVVQHYISIAYASEDSTIQALWLDARYHPDYYSTYYDEWILDGQYLKFGDDENLFIQNSQYSIGTLCNRMNDNQMSYGYTLHSFTKVDQVLGNYYLVHEETEGEVVISYIAGRGDYMVSCFEVDRGGTHLTLYRTGLFPTTWLDESVELAEGTHPVCAVDDYGFLVAYNAPDSSGVNLEYVGF